MFEENENPVEGNGDELIAPEEPTFSDEELTDPESSPNPAEEGDEANLETGDAPVEEGEAPMNADAPPKNPVDPAPTADSERASPEMIERHVPEPAAVLLNPDLPEAITGAAAAAGAPGVDLDLSALGSPPAGLSASVPSSGLALDALPEPDLSIASPKIPSAPGSEISAAGSAGNAPATEKPSADAGTPLMEGEFKPFEPFEAPKEGPKLSGDLPADDEMLDLLITDEQVKKLWARADAARERVAAYIDDLNKARDLNKQIKSAKTYLLAGRTNFEEADEAINEVTFQVSFEIRAKKWRNLGFALLSYEIVWGVFLGFLLLYIPLLVQAMEADPTYLGQFNFVKAIEGSSIQSFASVEEIFNAVVAAVWGGLGGVLGAFYSLNRYISRENNFTPRHTIWYISSPVMGLPIGAFIFLFMKIFLIVASGSVGDSTSPWLLYTLALIAGFQQNVIYDLIKQVLKRLEIKDPNQGDTSNNTQKGAEAS